MTNHAQPPHQKKPGARSLPSLSSLSRFSGGPGAPGAAGSGGLGALSSMYTEIVIEHDKRPLHAGLREPFDAEVHHLNPTCGDEITLRVHVEGEGDEARVVDLSYEASGCAMSRASASVMADLLIGHTLRENLPIVEHMETVMGSRGQVEPDEDLIGDGIALAGANRFPARVKCVLMPWKAYRAALVEAETLGTSGQGGTVVTAHEAGLHQEHSMPETDAHHSQEEER